MLQVINPIKNALQQGWKKLPKKRIASFVGMFIFCAMATYASSKGAGGFTKATTEISSYQTPVDDYDDYRWLCGIHRHVGGTSHVLQVRANGDKRRCPCHRLMTVGHFLFCF